MKDYTLATIEEYFNTPNDTNAVWTIPAKALGELEIAKNSKNRTELVNKTLKKYLINAQQAKTNAKIVEALLA